MQAKELIAKAHAAKASLDAQRTELQQQGAALEDSIAPQLTAIRQKVKALHAKILPYDLLLVNLVAADKMKGEAQETILKALSAELEGVTNGNA